MPVQDLARWLISGFVQELSGVEPASAFEHATLSFGQTSLGLDGAEELARLFEKLDRPSKRRFHEAIASAIDLVGSDEAAGGTIRKLVEAAVLTRCNDAVVSLTIKLRVPSSELRSTVYGVSHLLLAERDTPHGVMALAEQILRNGDFPDFLSMFILVATARYKSDALVSVAFELEKRLQRSLLARSEWPRGYERFRGDFVDALFRADRASDSLQELLKSSFYSMLILPSLHVVSPGIVRPQIEPSLKEDIFLRAHGLSSSALRHLFGSPRRTVSESMAVLA
jgi:hypothetical protein